MAEVLIVDDSESMRQLLTSTLVEAGHQVTSAEDGVKALAAAKTLRPALVIADINMPNMDGHTLVGELRKLPTYKFTPILILTTEMDPQKKAMARAVGATGWLVKPFDPMKLIATINKVVS